MTLCRHNIQLTAHYICIQTAQLHSTTLTLTLDTLKRKDAVAAAVPWKTFTSIFDF